MSIDQSVKASAEPTERHGAMSAAMAASLRSTIDDRIIAERQAQRRLEMIDQAQHRLGEQRRKYIAVDLVSAALKTSISARNGVGQATIGSLGRWR